MKPEAQEVARARKTLFPGQVRSQCWQHSGFIGLNPRGVRRHPRPLFSVLRNRYLYGRGVGTFLSAGIYRCRSVVISCPRADRTVCVRSTRIESCVDFGIDAHRRAAINVVAHHRGRARAPGKRNTILRRNSPSGERFCRLRVGSIAVDRQSCGITAALRGREVNVEIHTLAAVQRERKRNSGNCELWIAAGR